MAAANTDKLRKLSRKWVGQIGAGGVSDAIITTIPLASTTNLPTDTAVTVVIDRVDASGTKTPAKEETIVGVVSGSNLVTALRGVEGTAQAHAAGAVVEVLVTADGYNDIIDHLLVSHNQNGYHSASSITASMMSASSVVIGATNFVSTNVTLSENSDTLVPSQKATKTYTDNRITTFGIQVFDSATDTATGDAKAFFTVPSQLNGFNLTAVKATVYTAGTTNTTDIQLRNKTDSVDMLSTKMTIDSTETDTSTAATPAVIDTTKDDVATGDVIAIDVDAVSTTAARGLFVLLTFAKP